MYLSGLLKNMQLRSQLWFFSLNNFTFKKLLVDITTHKILTIVTMKITKNDQS